MGKGKERGGAKRREEIMYRKERYRKRGKIERKLFYHIF